ncbi:centrosomal protein of 95 kDa [Protopterus annectens]|uniref:centrosomal protein of 95 kDa n=1 Tax=Protopterus annectens TaxID=7888 RepID=UPI001CFAFB75|nr:centrosomal protein of 95 kDa [Protopterus annectens]
MDSREEKDWVDVANDLLSKCHVNLRVKTVTECDASLFVALYEAILGEKVPDYIATPGSQEDDVHNVQAVIDSLALDYLQISLSHITGENVVRGDKESLQNLLEIFDGLFEYLTEQISETSSHNGDETELVFKDGISVNRDLLQEQLKEHYKESASAPKSPPSPKASEQHFDTSLPSWDTEGSESTAELIRLGDSAYTFTLRKNELPEPLPTSEIKTDNINTSAAKLGEPIRPAVPLQPPYQPKEHRSTPETESKTEGQTNLERQPPLSTHAARSSELESQVIPQESTSEVGVDTSHQEISIQRIGGSSDDRRAENETEISTVQKKVAFRTLPDIKIMTLQSALGNTEQWSSSSKQEETVSIRTDLKTQHSSDNVSEDSLDNESRYQTDPSTSIITEPLSRRSMRNKLSEQELHDMAERLSRKLNELDSLLKQALDEQTVVLDAKEEDKLSQHSDSFMEYRRKKHQPTTPLHRKQSRARSLSPSPQAFRQALHMQFEDALNKEAKDQMGKIRREVQKEMDAQRRKMKVVEKAYEDDLENLETIGRMTVAKEKIKVNELDQDYKANLLRSAPAPSTPSKVYSRKKPQTPKNQWTPSGGLVKPRKGTPMKIKDNDLLPLLMEEFPYLHISPHALNKMWKQQFRQIEQLSKSASEEDRTKTKLQNEVEEAQRKHDILVEIIRKEQEHNQRLKEFKERIQQQKYAQNKIKERRHQIARAKNYYEDYHVQLRAKMMRARTREERIFRKLFEEGLEIQKERLHELRQYSKEKREEQKKRHNDEIESMENYYKDQFSMLAEAVSQERQEIQMREKVQAKALQKLKKELRSKMEKEIKELQDMITKDDDDAYFRELEAERLKHRIQMASFQYSKNHLL